MEKVGLEWRADVRCSHHQNLAHRKAMGLCYCTACTWKFNTWFMSLSNKSSTGKAVFQILIISWVENRSGLTTFSPPSPFSIHPVGADSTMLPAQPCPAGPLGESSLGHTHKGLFTFSIISFPLETVDTEAVAKWFLKNEQGLICLHLCLWRGLQAGFHILWADLATHTNAVQELRNRNIFSRASVLLKNEISIY